MTNHPQTLVATSTHGLPFADMFSHIYPPPEYLIVGAGVGGLTMGAMLERAGIPYAILERRKEGSHMDGADLGVFPAAISILRDLGLAESFWPQHSTPIKHVHLCKATFKSMSSPPTPAAGSTPSSCSSPRQKPLLTATQCAPRGSISSLGVDSDVSFASTEQSRSGSVPSPRQYRWNASDDPRGSISSSSNSSKLKHTIEHQRQTEFTVEDEVSNHLTLAPMVHALAATTPLKSLNVENIVGKGHALRMTNRRSLMIHLQELVPREKILFESQVLQCNERRNMVEVIFTKCNVMASVTVPVVIGADGVRSVCRRTIETAKSGAQPPENAIPRYSGEICFRGSFALSQPVFPTTSTLDGVTNPVDLATLAMRRRVEDLIIKADFQKPHSVTLFHDRGTRFSFGFLNEVGSMGYWWVREPFDGTREEFRALQHKRPGDAPPASWPEPLRSMYLLTQPQDFYLQPVVDRKADEDSGSWYSKRVVLLGDAAHPTTPALFQGANMAIEDAHLLAELIINHPPLVAPETVFAHFAEARLKHVSRIQRESFRQTKLGQLESRSSSVLRDAAIKLIPARFLERKLRKASSWSPEDAARDAVAKGRAATLDLMHEAVAQRWEQGPDAVVAAVVQAVGARSTVAPRTVHRHHHHPHRQQQQQHQQQHQQQQHHHHHASTVCQACGLDDWNCYCRSPMLTHSSLASDSTHSDTVLTQLSDSGLAMSPDNSPIYRDVVQHGASSPAGAPVVTTDPRAAGYPRWTSSSNAHLYQYRRP
ncbi:hypothetical protein BC828DRAFT_380506 [Blastocladiella britannica]|nr:hypothetical protein BC828DRAFT_380506 [Blastocladiella britannica]